MEKSRNNNKPIYIRFVDIVKAYDPADRGLHRQICRHYSPSDKIVRMLQLLYEDTNLKYRFE